MHDGVSVFTARFEPEDPPDGVIQAIHGFSEHVYLYTEMAEFFVKANYAFVIHDIRGFGSMPGKTPAQRRAAQGLVVNYQLILKDLETIREKIDFWYPDTPVILYGYSLGGNVAINYLFNYKQSRYEKLILASPWLRLYEQPSDFAMLSAKRRALMQPMYVFETTFDTSKIARTNQDGEAYDRSDDPYFHSRMSLKLFVRTVVAGEHAIKNASKITIPALLFVAGQDKIVCPDAIREFHHNAGDNIAIKEYPDAYHALLNDLVKDEVMEEMLRFVLS